MEDRQIKADIRFAAIDKYIERNIVLPTERKVSRPEDMVEWGDGNMYPHYLLSLYRSVPTLASIINGFTDYISGEGASVAFAHPAVEQGALNAEGETTEEQVRKLARDYAIYGGFALQVIRDHAGEVAGIYHIPMRFLRTNEDCNVFYYSEKWDRMGRKDVSVYPKFTAIDKQDPEAVKAHASSMLYVKAFYIETYPVPLYASAVEACEIERNIDEYHLNNLENSFMGSIVVNFNNGVPEDKIKEQIEKDFNEKFSGHRNAGRVMFSWNPNRESRTEITTPSVHDFSEKYNALAERSRQQIFTAFRANPNLFGIPTEGNGFSNEEYAESFRLFNKTMIMPAQKLICGAYDKILSRPGAAAITPFSLGKQTMGGEL